jgi:hypothetical protein
MGLLKKLEQAAAKQLLRVFLDAKKFADVAITDISKAEQELEKAKIKAAEAVQRQHETAVEAANKAREVADRLAIEAKEAEERTIQLEQILKNK